MRKLLYCSRIIIAVLVLPGYSHAQNKTRISGSIADSSGKPISLVTVRIFIQADDGALLQTSTSKSGAVLYFHSRGTLEN